MNAWWKRVRSEYPNWGIALLLAIGVVNELTDDPMQLFYRAFLLVNLLATLGALGSLAARRSERFAVMYQGFRRWSGLWCALFFGALLLLIRTRIADNGWAIGLSPLVFACGSSFGLATIVVWRIQVADKRHP